MEFVAIWKNWNLKLDLKLELFVCFFVCIAAKPQVMGPGLTNERTLSAVPSRILINSSRCDTTPVANSCNQHFSLEGDITVGGHPSKYWLSRCCLTSVLKLAETGVFNIARRISKNFKKKIKSEFEFEIENWKLKNIFIFLKKSEIFEIFNLFCY
jgi:hypothetical protein